MAQNIETKKSFLSGVNPPIFYPSALLITIFVLFTISFPERASLWFGAMQTWIIDTFGWFYLMAMGIYLLLTLVFAFSRAGKIRLGPDHSKPQYSNISWFSMLFSAGMGIGLIFYGVAEPVLHFANPPVGEGMTQADAVNAMKYTFFHWGIHAWGVYAIVALALGYFSFRKGLPLRLSSALYPIVGERIYGPIGYIVDILAVFGTMFGIATSLGLGVLQINSGLSYLFGIPSSTTVQIILVIVVTLITTISVAAGIDKGIRRLSEWNLILAVALLLFVALVGPTLLILKGFGQNIGGYIGSLLDLTFNHYVFSESEQTKSFLGGWTLFYWAWFIAWSPFVGMFIARISRGRTIKEFVLGVLFVPVGITAIWFTVFGDTALNGILTGAMPDLIAQVTNDTSTALFQFLDRLPLASISSVLATILVFTFFITSADSGSLVINALTAKEGVKTPARQRVFWAIAEGVVAGALIVAGGQNVLSALQAASLASALPFAPVLLLVGFGLFKSLRLEIVKHDSSAYMNQSLPSSLARIQEVGWKDQLVKLISRSPRKEVVEFLENDVLEAMQEVAEVFKENGLATEIIMKKDNYCLYIDHGDERNFVYGCWVREVSIPSFLKKSEKAKYPNSQFYIEVYLQEGSQGYDITGYTKNQLIADMIDQYERHLYFLGQVR